MAYNYAADTIQTLLNASGFVESKETITLDEFPSSVSDKAYSITLSGIEPSSTDVHDRLFPVCIVKITAVYFIGNNSFELYENAVDWNEDLISLVMNPDNRHSTTRIINFQGSATSQKSDEAKNFLMIENTFSIETALLYAPELSIFVYTDTSADEDISGGEYTTASYPSTIQAGTY